MWDRYDARDCQRDRNDAWDRDLGGRGSTSDRNRNDERDSRDVFTKDLDLPRGPERWPVRERDRVYEINGTESRMLATIGAFRVVSETDRHDLRDDPDNPRRSARHLEREGLIRTSPLSSDDRAVTLTDRGRDLLEANPYERNDRAHEPRQTFHAGIRKPRELTHDTRVYRAYLPLLFLDLGTPVRAEWRSDSDCCRRRQATSVENDGVAQETFVVRLVVRVLARRCSTTPSQHRAAPSQP